MITSVAFRTLGLALFTVVLLTTPVDLRAQDGAVQLPAPPAISVADGTSTQASSTTSPTEANALDPNCMYCTYNDSTDMHIWSSVFECDSSEAPDECRVCEIENLQAGLQSICDTQNWQPGECPTMRCWDPGLTYILSLVVDGRTEALKKVLAARPSQVSVDAMRNVLTVAPCTGLDIGIPLSGRMAAALQQ
ncbi:MAG: hypothetical protein WEA24_11780 [Gemmatimonadota bacterium]